MPGPQRSPEYLDRFVGRRRELETLRGLVAAAPLVTVLGAPGSGKTRLAEQFVGDHPAAGFAELAGVGDPRLVAGCVLAACGGREPPGRPAATALTELAAGRELLVVLDNCEHVVEAAAGAAHALLAGGPGVRVLATSREPLHLPGEVVWAIPGLGADAPLLFADRAAAHTATRVDAADPLVQRICATLDGLPLAVELAAARMAEVELADLVAQVDARPGTLLRPGRRGRPGGRDLADAIAASVARLAPPEQALLRRLAPLSGFDRRAARALATDLPAPGSGPSPSPDVLANGEAVDRALDCLVERSLVAVRGDDVMPYRLLQAVRDVAERDLAGSAEEADVRRRHATHYADLAAQADALRLTDTGRATLHAAAANFRVALAHAVATDDAKTALTIAGGLGRWSFEAQLFADGRAACAAALGCGDPQEHPALAAAAYWAEGVLGLLEADVPAVVRALTDGAALAESAGSPTVLGRFEIFRAAAFAGVLPEQAAVHGARAAELLADSDDPTDLAYALATLNGAQVNVDAGLEAAADTARRALALCRGADYAYGEGLSLRGLGHALLGLGHPAAALEHMREAERICAETSPFLEAFVLGYRLLADARLGRGAVVRPPALAAYERLAGATPMLVPALALGLGTVDLALGDPASTMAWADVAAASQLISFQAHAELLRAVAASQTGDPARARRAADRVLELAPAPRYPTERAGARVVLGDLALAEEDQETAAAHWRAALELQLASCVTLDALETIERLAAFGTGHDPLAAAAALSFAAAERARRGAVRVPERPDLDEARTAALGALGHRATGARSTGESWDLADAAAAVCAPPPGSSETGWKALTASERQVAELAAEGLSNVQIAGALLMSRSSVKLHLSRTFAKLGVSSRVQLAALAARREAG